jgi:hypothetical protein
MISLSFIQKLTKGTPPTAKSKAIQRKKPKRNALDVLPDEIIISIFRYLSPQDLARAVSTVNKRCGYLWPLSVQCFNLKGKIRKMNEEAFVKIFRKFVRLESFDIQNSGSSDDFQLTDAGLLQLAHKYIYSDADLITRPLDPYSKEKDVFLGEYDFNFDYESHLDSLDSSVIENMDTEHVNMDDLSDDDTESSLSTKRESILKVKLKQRKSQIQKIVDESDEASLHYYNSLKHSYFYYPPPIPTASRDPSTHAGPQFGLRTLKSLTLTGCTRFTAKGMKYLTYMCQNLVFLNLKGCNKMNDETLEMISQFSHLEQLNITGCTHITDVGLSHLAKLKKLKSLDLTFCHQITDGGLKHIAQIESLEEIDLTCCRRISTIALEALGETAKSLKYLNFTGCDGISICASKKAIPKLERIQLMGCKRTCDDCLKKIATSCPNLKEISIAYCDLVTDIGVESLIKYCPNLSVLNVKRCLDVSDKTLELASVNCKDLKVLNVTGCRLVSDIGMQSISTLSKLSELMIRRCPLVTDEGIKTLKDSKCLATLDISECHLVTEESIKLLCDSLSAKTLIVDKRVQQVPQDLSKIMGFGSINKRTLKDLRIENCPKVSKEFVDMLHHRYRLQVMYSQ